jgi:addiction module HigA family antidote
LILREYLEPLGVSPAEFARHLGIDGDVMGRICRGETPLTVATATRIARALQISADRIINMQIRHDVAAAKTDPTVVGVGVLPMPAAPAFPDVNVLHGRLAETSEPGYDGLCWFFKEERERAFGESEYDGLHALWRGDVLRVFDPSDKVIFVGPVLKDLDGRMLLPYARFQMWIEWFLGRFRADLALGAEHLEFLNRLAKGA